VNELPLLLKYEDGAVANPFSMNIETIKRRRKGIDAHKTFLILSGMHLLEESC
jgi:hypothetical protein